VVKNGRWYLSSPGGLVTKVGWGDLAWDDLERIANVLAAEQVFLVLPENPPGGMHLPFDAHTGGRWCWSDRPDHIPGPTISELAAGAQFSVAAGEVHVVDNYARANRLGYVWVQRGYRYTRTGRLLSTGKVRVHALPPTDLAALLTANAGSAEARAANDRSSAWVVPPFRDDSELGPT
jgi:hypothetical protein